MSGKINVEVDAKVKELKVGSEVDIESKLKGLKVSKKVDVEVVLMEKQKVKEQKLVEK